MDGPGRICRDSSDLESEQRLGLLVGVAACVLLCVVFAVDFHRAGPVRGIELDSRINPNDAPVSSLVRLPGIGLSRAEAIAAYRRSCEAPAFRDAEDLQKVKGIGPRTVENIAPFLEFE